MVWHHFYFYDLCIKFFGYLLKYFFEPNIHSIYQNFPAIF